MVTLVGLIIHVMLKFDNQQKKMINHVVIKALMKFCQASMGVLVMWSTYMFHGQANWARDKLIGLSFYEKCLVHIVPWRPLVEYQDILMQECVVVVWPTL